MNTIHKQLESILMADEKKVKRTTKAAAGVIKKEDAFGNVQILLIQRAKDDHWPLVWEFPRGKCDKPPGENVLHCLKREIKEETGLDVIPIKLIDKVEYLADKGERKTTCYNFLCELKNPDQKVKLSHEHEGCKWVGEMGEIELMVTPEQKRTIEKVLNLDRALITQPGQKSLQTVEEYLKIQEVGAIGNAVGKVSSMLSPISSAYFAVLAIKMAFDLYKNNFSRLAKMCGNMPQLEKSICMLNAKYKAKVAEANKLRASLGSCSKDKNPAKCRERINAKITQVMDVAKMARDRMEQYKRAPIQR